MQRFILFLKKIIFLLLFVVIEVTAIRVYTSGSTYNQAKMANLSNFLLGDIRSASAGVKQYFSLASENRRLTEEVALLREQIETFRLRDTLLLEYSPSEPSPYRFTTARVVNNTVARADNFITLNKGRRDGIKPDMAVISDGAIVGYILDCSDKFSVAISVLNSKFSTSGKILNEEHSGSVYWDGKSYDEIVLSEIPKYAELAVGDTIVTTDFSSRFPEGIKIGTVREFELVNGTYYKARVKLLADMGSLNNVVLVDYSDLTEKEELENRAAGIPQR